MSDQITDERKPSTIVRQSSRCVKTDDTGDSINTINTMLYNLSETIKKANESVNIKENQLNDSSLVNGVKKVNITKSTQPKTIKSKVIVSKIKNNPKISLKPSTSLLLNKRSKKNLKKLAPLKKPSVKELFEIYRNQQAIGSNSSNIDTPKCRIKNRGTKLTMPPPLNLSNNSNDNASSKNYEMPTVSSKIKRVGKNYINSSNLKSIPFCAAKSTSPSHNVGMNVQQVMNMMKNQTVIQKLSPALINSITLATEKSNQQPISSIISNMTTKTSQCPLMRNKINYQHYQELAKCIPEENEDMLNNQSEDKNDSPGTESLYITGPSGDVKVKNRKRTNWFVNNDEKKCTCIPQKGVDFQQVFNKYTTNNNKHQLALEKKQKRLEQRLHKLHDEFEMMNKRYEEITETSANNSTKKTQKEIIELDKKLCQKEEDVKRIMSIYEEVLLLKQQANKDLKQTSKIATTTTKIRNSRNTNLSFNEPKSATKLLDKLLKQVQQLQNKRN